MQKILVTGGCGYIGGHTIVDLIDNGFDVVSVDDMSRGSARMLAGIQKITGREVKNYEIDLCDAEKTKKVFEENPDIVGVIHFAAYKSVPESVREPLLYYQNNLVSLLNILDCVKSHGIKNVIFSSSCSVYGNTTQLPVLESTPFGVAESPYARTKQLGEEIVGAYGAGVILRYFNPVGAHPSALIGEFADTAENLAPVITQTASGIRPSMKVFGKDYPTVDGTCVRDYIYIMDLANAHTKALQYSMSKSDAGGERKAEVFNLGTGAGTSVLELISAFEKVSNLKLNYEIVGRRDGDVVEIYADSEKAQKILGWIPKGGLGEMMDTAWRFEQAKKAL